MTRKGRLFKFPALPGFEWVQVQPPAVEVDGRLEVLGVAEAPRRLLHPLNGRVHGLEARVGDPMLMVRQDVGQVAPDQPGYLCHRLEPAMGGPPEPAREEPLGRTQVRVLPEVPEAFFERPGAPDLEITAQQLPEGPALLRAEVARAPQPEVLRPGQSLVVL